MPRHPTVLIPNIGPMDHAWDLLGEWQAEFELPEAESPVHGKVTFRSWTDAELQLDPVEAAIAGIPSSVPSFRLKVNLTLPLPEAPVVTGMEPGTAKVREPSGNST